jgi:hypothetical protein
MGHPFLCAAETNGLDRPQRYIKATNNEKNCASVLDNVW